MKVIEKGKFISFIGTKKELKEQRLKELKEGKLVSELEPYDGKKLYCFVSRRP